MNLYYIASDKAWHMQEVESLDKAKLIAVEHAKESLIKINETYEYFVGDHLVVTCREVVEAKITEINAAPRPNALDRASGQGLVDGGSHD
jgi:hypothetical protein